MKLFHLSDLHLGKRLGEFSLLEDQAYILNEILGLADAEMPDGILLAGDIFDKSVPSAEAVALFDGFLSQLAARELAVFVISGNHDSPERIAYGGSVMRKSRVYVSPVYDGTVQPVTLEDGYGPVDIFLLPFVKPAHVRRWYPDEPLETYTDAVACAVAQMPVQADRRNVLVTHQFVTGAARCESEEISVGGSDNVDAAVFSAFDYVALGHIHSPQNVGTARIRYCGTPLKYSFSETAQEKSVTVVELGRKGELAVRLLPLRPMRELLQLRGTYLELTSRAFYASLDRSAFVHITLTDEEDVPEALGRLRVVYPNLTRLEYDNRRTRSATEITGPQETVRKSPLDLFSEFYLQQNNQPMTEEQTAFLRELTQKIWEDTP